MESESDTETARAERAVQRERCGESDAIARDLLLLLQAGERIEERRRCIIAQAQGVRQRWQSPVKRNS
jgi:hypothetical protein